MFDLHSCSSRKFLSVIFAVGLFLLTAQTVFAEENNLFVLKIPLTLGANVTASLGGNVYDIGKVNALPTKTRYPSYTASAWGGEGEVCASAVNAIHMLVSVENKKGRTMSIIPQQTIAPAAGAGASVVISSKAGEGIFGAWAPPAGSAVFVQKNGSLQMAALSKANLPSPGDEIVIIVQKMDLPYMVEIENRPGGRVTVWDKGGYTTAGRVIRAVSGTGRFEGTLFQRIGAIRANHSGVIDISTSPVGKIGGFQIIPWDHALTSKEMQGAWDMAQWLIIAAPNGKSSLGATYPLFKYGLVPGTASEEKLWDVWSTYGRKSLVLARIKGGNWEKLPDISGRNDAALKNLTHIRIYYPFVTEPQKAFYNFDDKVLKD